MPADQLSSLPLKTIKINYIYLVLNICLWKSGIYSANDLSRTPLQSVWRQIPEKECLRQKERGQGMSILTNKHERKATLFFNTGEAQQFNLLFVLEKQQRIYICEYRQEVQQRRVQLGAEDICGIGIGIKDRQLTECLWCHFIIIYSQVTHILFRYLDEIVICKTI